MPPRQYDIQGLANSLSGLSNAITSDINKQIKEKAHSDLLNMQANLDIEANRFMNELSQSSNYEDWNSKYDEWLKKQSNTLQKESANQYTAKAANEMLMGYSTNMRKNIENKVFDMRNRDILLKNNDTVNLIMQNDGLTGQDKMDQLSNISNREVLNGLITPEQYIAKQQNYATSLYLNHYANLGSQLIPEAIKNGESLQSIKDKINSDDFSISLKAVAHDRTTIEDYDEGTAQYTDITHTLDQKAIKEKAMKSIEQQYKTALTDMQNQSAKELSEYYTGIWQPGNNTQQQLYLCKQGLSLLKNNYGGDRLSEDDRIKYTNMFKSLEKTLTSGSGGNGSGSGSAKLEAFATFIKGLPDAGLSKIASGEYENTYEAKAVIQKVIEEQYFNNEWTETDGLTPKQKAEYFENNYSNFGEKLLECAFLKKRLTTEPQFASLNVKYNSIIKDIEKNPQNYSNESAQIIGEFVYDVVASTGKEVTPEQLKNLDSMINACQVSKLDKMFKGKLKDQLAAAEDNDLVFTNTSREERFAPGAEEKLKALSSNLAADIKSKTGLEVNFKRFEKVPNDETSIPVFVDAAGNEYKARTIRDKKGNVKDIEYVDEKGNVLDTEAMKKENAAKKAEIKQAQQDAHDLTRQLENKKLREKIEEEKKKYGEDYFTIDE